MRHVLVVDQPAICAVVQMGLETDGSCRVTSAWTTHEALSVMMGDRPDAAILDAVTPRGLGLALAGQAVDLGIPVLILTGEPDTQARLSMASCPYLAKPFHLHALIARTHALLDAGLQRRAELAILLRGMTTRFGELVATVERARDVAKAQRDRVGHARHRFT